MVRIETLHVRAHLPHPFEQRVSGFVGLAARLVGEFPRHDGRIVLVSHTGVRVHAVYQVSDVFLVFFLDFFVPVKVIVVCPFEPLHVLAHPSKIVPVVREHDDQLYPELPSFLYDIIEPFETILNTLQSFRYTKDSWERMHVGFLFPAPLFPIQKSPHPENCYTHILCTFQDAVDHPVAFVVQVITVAANKPERLAIECEHSVFDSHE